MGLNAKDETQDVLVRKGEAVPSEAMRPKPVAVALTDVTGLVLSRKSADENLKDETPRTSQEGIAASAAKPPSSLLDYRLVRVSSRMDDHEFRDEDTPVPAGDRYTRTQSARYLPQDAGPQGSFISRRLVQGAALVLALSLVVVFVIAALLAL
jgi:hypothetical protein